jgi:hypothetical protein
VIIYWLILWFNTNSGAIAPMHVGNFSSMGFSPASKRMTRGLQLLVRGMRSTDDAGPLTAFSTRRVYYC